MDVLLNFIYYKRKGEKWPIICCQDYNYIFKLKINPTPMMSHVCALHQIIDRYLDNNAFHYKTCCKHWHKVKDIGRVWRQAGELDRSQRMTSMLLPLGMIFIVNSISCFTSFRLNETNPKVPHICVETNQCAPYMFLLRQWWGI